MRKILLISVLFLTSCQMMTHKEDGVTYIKGQIGLGIVNKEVPNLVEFDVPAMKTSIVFPVFEDLAEVTIKGTGGIFSWLGGLGSRFLSFVGLAPN